MRRKSVSLPGWPYSPRSSTLPEVVPVTLFELSFARTEIRTTLSYATGRALEVPFSSNGFASPPCLRVLAYKTSPKRSWAYNALPQSTTHALD